MSDISKMEKRAPIKSTETDDFERARRQLNISFEVFIRCAFSAKTVVLNLTPLVIYMEQLRRWRGRVNLTPGFALSPTKSTVIRARASNGVLYVEIEYCIFP